MRRVIAFAICLLALPGASADNHTIIDSENQTDETWGIDDLTQWHCKGAHVPLHCGNATYTTAAGTFTARWGLEGGAWMSPLPVLQDSTLTLSVTYDGPVGGAAVEVTMTVEDDSGILFETHEITKAVSPGDPVAFAFPFKLVPDWPRGDLLGPHIVMAIANEGEAETWVPMQLTLPTVPTQENRTIIPWGWLGSVLGLVVAAAIVGDRRGRA